MVSASFTDNVEECLEYSLIQQDEPPVDLFVNLTADPCPEITWYLNDAALTDLSYYNPNDTVVSGIHVHVAHVEQYEITMYVATCILCTRWFESHPRQLIFLWESNCLGCTVLLCLFV